MKKSDKILMKLFKEIFSLAVASLTFLFLANPIIAQEEMLEDNSKKTKKTETLNDEHVEKIDERTRYYKDKYEMKLDKSWDEVWEACLAVIDDRKCQVMQKKSSQTDEGLNKGSIQTDFCVFASGNQEVKDSLIKYSYNLPNIRGGVWETGRIQHKFILKESEDMTVNLLLKSEISGRENNVTNQVHFWQSNGYLETITLELLKKKLNISN